jgi:glyoxylase-like metal-dependent hydrolase (beta-lactamase superfamily II)
MPKTSARTSFAFVLFVAGALAACSRSTESPAPSANATETAQTAESRKFASFQIGDLQAIALRGGSLSFPNDGKIFAINRAPEDVAGVLTAAGLPTDQVGLSLQPLLVRAGDKVLLFDTGAGTNFGPDANGLPDALAAAGVDPASVTDIFISHIHGDHVGGLVNADGALMFPNATIHMSSPDWNFLKSLDANSAPANTGIQQYDALIAAIEPKVSAFSPGAELVPGIVTAVEIKGHTPGHSGYRITSGESSLLYIGDTVHHYIISVQKPNWTIAFDGDAPTAETSRSEVLARAADTGERLYAVHFPFPGVGKVERRGEEFVWVPESL